MRVGQAARRELARPLDAIPLRDGEQQVWTTLADRSLGYCPPGVRRPQKKTPYTQDTYNYWNTLLKKDGVTRAVLFNLAWLNPVASAIPNDEFSLPRAADAGKYHFYKAGEPMTPDQWPLGKTITIGVLQKKVA